MTDTKLIDDLRPFAGDEMIATIIKNARERLYHDFSLKIATPKLLLINHLSAIQKATPNPNLKALLTTIITKVKDGDYDEDP